MKKILVGKNHFALVSAIDYSRVSKFHWTSSKTKNAVYAVRHAPAPAKPATVTLQREILRPKADEIIVFRDGNTLNCLRKNLMKKKKRGHSPHLKSRMMIDKIKRKKKGSRTVIPKGELSPNKNAIELADVDLIHGEIWKPVSGFILYEASTEGRVKHKFTNKLLPIYGEATPAPAVVMTRGDKHTTKVVPRLILETFVGPPPDSRMIAWHKDRDKRNNRLSNLEWGYPNWHTEYKG